MSVSNAERELIYIADAVASSISLAGCSFIVLMYALFKDLRGAGFKLVLILSIFDIISCFSFLIPTYASSNNDPACVIQAAVLNFSSLCGIFWSFIIALMLYRIIVTNKSFPANTNLLLGAVILLSAVCSAVPFVTNSYGTTAGWCWIQLKSIHNPDFYERLFLFFLPILGVVAANMYFIVMIKHKLREIHRVERSEDSHCLNHKLTLYPVIIIICYLPYVIKQVIELTNWFPQDSYEFWFTFSIGVLRSLHGFFNSLVYGFTARVRNKLREIIADPGLLARQKLMDTDINGPSVQ
jgi:cAMP receptor-like G-protein coupled receptor